MFVIEFKTKCYYWKLVEQIPKLEYNKNNY